MEEEVEEKKKKKMMMGKKGNIGGGDHDDDHEVMDGSDLMELVENEKVFNKFVDHKFEELDRDCDGKLCVKELQPAVADIGAALGLPAKGASPDSDHIYTQVLEEFTDHGDKEEVSKSAFKEVLSDILLGMAAGLKRDPIVILRIDGEDLLEFAKNASYEPELVSIFSEIASPEESLKEHIIKAFGKLKVEQGMPPASDSWVISNVIEPVLQSCSVLEEQNVSLEKFLVEFKDVVERVAQHLKEQPVIVAHSESTFDGSGTKRLLSNKFELDKTLDAAMASVPKDRSGKISKEYLRVVLDFVAPSAGLPPFGAVEQMDKLIAESFKMLDADDGKIVKEEEFKKIMAEILGSIMLQLEGNPVSVSTNSVVHEPLTSASTLLQPST